ncbi:hypothetical protein Q5752_006289 [Cryptotrichosporon argae]
MSPSEDELASDPDRHSDHECGGGGGGGGGGGNDSHRHGDKRLKAGDGPARRALEAKREKNRIKQRNLRERRANHVAELEQTVSRLQTAVREHEARLAAADAREDALAGYARALEGVLVTAGREADAAALRRAWPASALVRDRPVSLSLWDRDGDRPASFWKHDDDHAASAHQPRRSPIAWTAHLDASVPAVAAPSRQPYTTPTHEPIGVWPAPRDLDRGRTQTLPPLRARERPPSSPSAPTYSSPTLSPALALSTFPALAPLPPFASTVTHPSSRWSTLPPPAAALAPARPPLSRASASTALSPVTAHRSPPTSHGADDAPSPSRVSIPELCTPLTGKGESVWPAERAEKDAPALPPIASFALPRTDDSPGQRRTSEISTVDSLLCPSRRESA